RDRGERWPNLEEFRRALLPFAPGHLTAAGPGVRFAALLIDLLICWPVNAGLHFLYAWLATRDVQTMLNPSVGMQKYLLVAPVVVLLYYVTQEGIWDASLGKRFLGLRVRTATGLERPGVLRALVRTLVWYLLVALGGTVTGILMVVAFGQAGG